MQTKQTNSPVSGSLPGGLTLKNLYALFDEVPFAVALLMGESLVIEFINQYNLDIWQRTREEVIGKPLFDVFPGNRAAAQPIHEQIFRTGQRFVSKELPVEMNVNGVAETKWFSTVIDPMRNEEGTIIGQIATTTEVTEQVAARQKSEESENYFRKLTDTVPAIIWITEPDGSCTYLNKHWYDYTGQTRREAEGFGWLDATHPDDKDETGKAFVEANAERKPFFTLYRLRNKAGEYRWAVDSGSPKFSADGVYEGMIGTVVDVHEQKMAEDSLRKTSAHLELATSSARVGTWSLHVPSGALQWSSLHKEMWGYEQQADLVYEDWHQVILPADKELAFNQVEEARRLHTSYDATYRIKRAGDAAIRWMRSTGRYFYDAGGEAIMLTGVTIDITAQKEAEAALLYRQAILEAQNEAIPDAVLIVDTKGGMISYNRHFATLWRIPKEIVDAKDDAAALAFAMTQVADPQGFIDRVNECYANPDKPAHEEVLFADGRIIERYGNAVKGEDGTNYGWIWYFRDITERKKSEDVLRASEDRYQNFVQRSSEGIWRFELEVPMSPHLSAEKQIEHIFQHAYLAECNDAMAKMYGYTRSEELLGARVAGFFPLDDDTKNYFHYFISSGYQVQEAESKEFSREGELRYFSNNLIGILEEGMLVRAWGTQRDITAQRAAEEKIRESERRFRTVIEEAPVATALLTGRELKIDIANEKMIAHMGKGPSVIGKTLAEALPELEGQPFLQLLDDVFATGKTFETKNAPAEVVINGVKQTLYFDYIFKPLKNAEDEVYAILDMSLDVTEQTISRKKLEESESLFRLLANEMPQFVWTGDAAGNLTYFNQAVYEYSGLSADEVANGGWIGIVHPEERDENVRLWLHSIATGKDFIFEHRFKRADGEYRWQLSRAVPQRDPQGVIQQWIGTSTDIQDRKKFEVALEGLVQERTKELNKLNIELQQSNEDLQQFAHVASHDLKEPVRKIKTFVSRIQEEAAEQLDERSNLYLAKVQSATDRMSTMIEGVLAYSTVNASEQVPQRVNLHDTLKHIETDLEVMIHQTGATIRCKNLPLLEGAPVLLYQLFYNLVNNSIKFARAGVPPVISIESSIVQREGQGFAKIVFSDNGIGFPQEKAQMIFDTFTRLHSKDKYEGTGLGLALCKKIAERHGGAIEATGKMGEGSTFVVWLPVTQLHHSI